MVFFSCDGCGEMLKKSQVDGHANRCRRCASVSCVDCNVSFFGDDYRVHTSCVTEVERYEKRGSDNNNSSKKNAKLTPQQLWMNLISSSISSAPNHLKSYIQTMSSLDNVPRKEKAFYNFTSNSLKLKSNNSIVKDIWNHLCDCRKQQQQEHKAKEIDVKNQKQQDKNEIGESIVDESAAPTNIIPPKSSDISIESDNIEGTVSSNYDAVDTKNNTANTKLLSESTKSNTKVDKKVIKKIVKMEFKKAKSNSIKLKLLQRLVKSQFHKENHGLVKEVFLKMIDQGKHFTKDGKLVLLKE